MAVKCLQCGVVFRTTSGRSTNAKFCSSLCYHRAQGTDNRAYLTITVGSKQVYQHRWLMEQHLGRLLLSTEHVHHINGNRRDNRIENLSVHSSRDHRRLHHVGGTPEILGPADRSLPFRP